MGNVAAILELDENLMKQYKVFEAAPQQTRDNSTIKREVPDYFLWEGEEEWGGLS